MAIQIIQKLKRKHNTKLYKSIRKRINHILTNIYLKWKNYVQTQKDKRIKINANIILNSNTNTKPYLINWIHNFRKRKEKEKHISIRYTRKWRYYTWKTKLSKILQRILLERVLINFSYKMICDCITHLNKFVKDVEFMKDGAKYIGTIQLIMKKPILEPPSLRILITKCAKSIDESLYPRNIVFNMGNPKYKISQYVSFLPITEYLKESLNRFSKGINSIWILSCAHPAKERFMQLMINKIYNTRYEIDLPIVTNWIQEYNIPVFICNMSYDFARDIVMTWLQTSAQTTSQTPVNIISMLNKFQNIGDTEYKSNNSDMD